MRNRILAVLIAASGLGGWLAAPFSAITAAEAGPQFQVNATVKGNQWFNAIARLTSGRFAVVWESDSGPSRPGDIYAQLFLEDGTRFGVNFPLGVGTRGKSLPAVAALTDGSFVAVWVSDRKNPLGSIYGQLVGPNGVTIGNPFLVSGNTGAHNTPAIAGLPDGDFVVVWASSPDGSSDDTYDIVGQRFSANGQKAGGRFLVNKFTEGAQLRSSVAGNPGGGFTVVWDSAEDDGSAGTDYRIRGQSFAADGTRSGSAFVVVRRNRDVRRPRIAMLAGDGFVVVWEGLASHPGYDIFAQRYADAGTKAGGLIAVTQSAKNELNPAVGALAGGGFVVAWANDNFADILAQLFAADGAPVGSSFRVNDKSDAIRDWPGIAPSADGGFAISWDEQGGASLDVLGRTFSP